MGLEDRTQVPIAGHLKNDFCEIFALICYQFFQMPFQYLSAELYEIIVSPPAGGGRRQLETGVSGGDAMRQRRPLGCRPSWGAARP